MTSNISKTDEFSEKRAKYLRISDLTDTELEELYSETVASCVTDEQHGGEDFLVSDYILLQIVVGEKSNRVFAKKTFKLWRAAICIGILGVIIALFGIWQTLSI
jgi:hypothetical protein